MVPGHLSGSCAYGGVYGSPFDDRFGSPSIGSFGNTFPLDASGGSLTVRRTEAISAAATADHPPDGGSSVR